MVASPKHFPVAVDGLIVVCPVVFAVSGRPVCFILTIFLFLSVCGWQMFAAMACVLCPDVGEAVADGIKSKSTSEGIETI